MKEVMNKVVDAIINGKKVNVVAHVHNTAKVFIETFGRTVEADTEMPGWFYIPVEIDDKINLVKDLKFAVPLFWRHNWYAAGEEKPAKKIRKRINGVLYVYVLAYASQGNLKSGTAVYILRDVWKLIRNTMWMKEPVTESLADNSGFRTIEHARRARSKYASIVAYCNSIEKQLSAELEAFVNNHPEGMTDDEYEVRLAEIVSRSEENSAKKQYCAEKFEQACAAIILDPVKGLTRQKHGQFPQLFGTGVERTYIPIENTVYGAHMLADDAREDKVVGFAKIDTSYSSIENVDTAPFCGADGAGMIGAAYADRVDRVMRRMMQNKKFTKMNFGFLQVRGWKGVMQLMPTVREMCEMKDIKPTLIDVNGKQVEAIELIRADGSEGYWTDESVAFTESMVKNEKFFDTWAQLIENLPVKEVLATSTHFAYNCVRMNRQFYELTMSQATVEEHEAVTLKTVEEAARAMTADGYIKQALAAIPEWSKYASMVPVCMHPGMKMTLQKKHFNKVHRAAAGKVAVFGDCLIATPDHNYMIDRLFAKYGFFEDNGKTSGTLGKNAEGYWEVRVPHAQERGLIGKKVVLLRSPYISPIICVCVVVGDSYCEGVIEIPMQEGCPIPQILSADFDGDHIYAIYEEAVITAAERMNEFVKACGGKICVFDDMPGDESIKTCSTEEYMAKARILSDVGLATTPIFKLASLLIAGAKPEDTIESCVFATDESNNRTYEKISMKQIVWAMMMVNAAVTRAADAIKRGAPNNFLESQNGSMINAWTSGMELSKIHDHCEELLGTDEPEYLDHAAEREADGKTGIISWSRGGIDMCAAVVSTAMCGTNYGLKMVNTYNDVLMENGGWMYAPDKSYWLGLPWWHWSIRNPETYEVKLVKSEFEGKKVYVDYEGKEFVNSIDEAIALWCNGIDVNLDDEPTVALIYSRLYRRWAEESRKASDYKRKIDLTDEAVNAAISVVKAVVYNLCGVKVDTDHKELAANEAEIAPSAHEILMMNLGMYLLGKDVTGTTADELRDYAKRADKYITRANAKYIEGVDGDRHKRRAEDEVIAQRIIAFKNSMPDVKTAQKRLTIIRDMMGIPSENMEMSAIIKAMMESDEEESVELNSASTDMSAATFETAATVDAFNDDFDDDDEEQDEE